LLAPFGARFSASSDPFRPATIRSLHADSDTVIVLWERHLLDSNSFNEFRSRVHPH
jgi:hypothetical protein